MAFCITFGTQEFTSQLKGAEGINNIQCRNCGNWRANCITRWPWFTVCFVPLIPLATHKYQEIACPVCRFHQDIKDRPDVQNMIANGGQGNQAPLQQYQTQGNGGGPPQGQPQGQPGGYYAQGGAPGGPKPQYA